MQFLYGHYQRIERISHLAYWNHRCTIKKKYAQSSGATPPQSLQLQRRANPVECQLTHTTSAIRSYCFSKLKTFSLLVLVPFYG